MKQKAHFNPKSNKWLISLAVMVVLSVAVIFATDAIYDFANKKYNEPVEINFEIVSTADVDISNRNTQPYRISKVSEAYDAQGRLVAYIVDGSVIGYNQESPIEMSTVISADGALVCGVDILSQEETEYLGVRIAGEEFKSQFDGRYLPVVSANGTDKGSKIDMLSNSTISSQAVIDGVNNAQAFVKENFVSAQVND